MRGVVLSRIVFVYQSALLWHYSHDFQSDGHPTSLCEYIVRADVGRIVKSHYVNRGPVVTHAMSQYRMRTNADWVAGIDKESRGLLHSSGAMRLHRTA